MNQTTDDLRIETLRPLLPPMILVNEELPITEQATATVTRARQEIEAILSGEDRRLLVVSGPCSVHDSDAAIEYAGRLKHEAARLADDLLVIMRVYFEKPRTTVGWKGLINDPDLDGTFNLNKGLRLARGLLLDLANMGLPTGSEFLDTITPQFTADLVSWGPSAPAPRKARCIGSWLPDCPCPWASRTAPAAPSRSPSTACAPRNTRIISWA